jgi:hypothetical protein
MATTTNYSWTTPDDTALVKDGAAAIRSLGTAIDSTVFTNAGAAVAKATVDAKGDLIAGTADNTIARLAVGANNTVLTADSTTATGLKWATPAAGGITLISETVASAISSLTLGSIPQTYKQLLLVWSGIYHSAGSNFFDLRFNNSSSSVYSTKRFLTRTSNGQSNIFTQEDQIGVFVNCQTFGANTTSSTVIDEQSGGFILIDDYASTTKFKNYQINYSYRNATVPEDVLNTGTGTFESTTEITSLDIYRVSGSGTFSNKTNTSIRLYGIS